jgi:hypothetical protein
MIGILNLSVPRERFTHAIEHGPEHLRSIMEAARDHGVGICVVPQGAEQFNPPRKRPNILIVGDDMHEAMGPDASHRKSLVRFIKRASGAVIVSCAPLPAAYRAAATHAAVFRQNILIVETRLRFEPVWKTFVETYHPGIALLLCTVEPQGGVQ